MVTTLTIDKAGRVVIPKSLRDELNLEPGDALELESKGEKVTLRPARSREPLRKKQGIWTYKSGRPLTVETTRKVLQNVREERDRRNRTPGA